MTNSQKTTIVILMGIFLLISIIINAIKPERPVENWPEVRPFYQISSTDDTIEEVWSRSNLFADSNWPCCPLMTAAAGKLFIDGSFDQPEEGKLLAFDGQNGALIWQVSDFWHSVTTLASTAEALYAGFNANGPVRAYNLETGEILWESNMPGDGVFPPRYTRRLRVFNNIIYVESADTHHFVQADTGDVLHAIERSIPNDKRKLEAELTKRFNVPVEYGHFGWDAYTDNIAFFKSEIGELRAYDRQTDDLLWQTNEVICNVVATESTVYYLTEKWELLGVKPRTRETVTLITFERNVPEDYAGSSIAPSGACYLSIDSDNDLLYVFIGNGAQLFAFRIME